MLELIAGLLLLLGTHSIVIVRPEWRRQAVARWGEPQWKLAYALLSLLGLWLIVQGYAAARINPVVLYHPPVWSRHLMLLLMVPVFTLLLATYLPGRIQHATKHPMLVAVKIWALAHLMANGTLADVLLFGGFLAWAVADRISLKRRDPGVVSVPGAPPSPWNDRIAILVGLLLYLVFLFWAHYWLFGRSPLE
ncbi:NnrU family protein [Rhabdochromatium marinum]|uniref:NnrU family protein n=1 Tax=Rhabdochromatium marinum TaxID=48729 RepID=UPI001903EF08|nr:NnrU family protein [Rhabdochromatium marinum]MBK1649372.1 NnrU family protein [Rhabdochromatium marinum]